LKNKFGGFSNDEKTQSQAGSSARHPRTCPSGAASAKSSRANYSSASGQDQLYSKVTIKQLPVTIQKPSLGVMYNQERLQTFKVAVKDTFTDSLAFCWKVKMATDGDVDGAAPVIVNNIYIV